MLTERAVRIALREALEQEHAEQDALVIDEFVLPLGYGRIDLAVFNGSVQGVEIKSSFDTLARLPNQVVNYGRIFETITLVTAESHVDEAIAILPEWWGLVAVSGKGYEVSFQEIRQNRANPNLQSIDLALCLWKEELSDLIVALCGNAPRAGLTRRKLAETLVGIAQPSWLRSAICEKIKSRANWRVDRPQIPNDD